eukprot:2524001-Lingulodinium_polyedra.AAC.1
MGSLSDSTARWSRGLVPPSSWRHSRTLGGSVPSIIGACSTTAIIGAQMGIPRTSEGMARLRRMSSTLSAH